MSFRPLHDRVVVRRLDSEEKTAGGIIIPDTAKEKPSEGEVISVGPGARDEAGKLVALDANGALPKDGDLPPKDAANAPKTPASEKSTAPEKKAG